MAIVIFVLMMAGTFAALFYLLLRPAGAPLAAPPASEGLCAQCGRALDADDAFCPTCGTPVARAAGLRCRHCGRQLDGDEVFCPRCGKKTQEANV